MSIEIHGLFQVNDIEQITSLFLDAFHDYPKLEYAFSKEDTRKAALEATIRFYCAYDMRYGKAYALDKKVDEAVVIVESNQMNYSFLRHFLSGSYSKAYRKAMKRLNKEERRKRIELFMELDRLEGYVGLPKDHLYLDFLGVKTKLQGQGKGRRLMEHICRYSDERKLPLMLFTNTEQDVRFYKSLGFETAGETSSQKFGFTNWYMVRFPQNTI